MSKSHLQIDLSESKREDDLIKIRLRNEDVVQVNFSKLVSQSKYVRDKYKYSDIVELIQEEIEEIKEKMKIKDESIKFFIELIQEEKIDLPIEHYKDIYTLSEYFHTPTITTVLDNISDDFLYKDLNFTLQFLRDSETLNNSYETKLTIKIEKFLSSHINECLSNDKFGELEISTIYRLLEKNKEKIDFNLLVDFIFESANTRFIIFKLVEIDKLSETKFYELIKFLESQEETTQRMYFEYIPFNLSIIKNITNKYNEILSEKNETKQKLNETQQDLNQTKQDLNETQQDLNQTKQELNEAKQDLNQTKQELNQTKQELNQAKQELNQAKQELNQAKQELKQIKDAFNQAISEKKRYAQSIIVGGYDTNNGLGEKANKNNIYGTPIISPPVKLPFDLSSFLSYSAYCNHSVLVMSNGSLKGIGNNEGGQISATLQKKVIKDFTDFCIKDSSGRPLHAISAVCCFYGTLYMFSKSSGNERQLVLCDSSINGGDPVFLDIGNHHPVSLFGGNLHSAAIGSEGEIIFINRNSIKKLPKSPIPSFSLPNGEKASSVACCDSSVVVLSLKGRVFTSPIESNGVLNFSIVLELSGQEIVCVSGTNEHILAVSKEGRVFGCGSNGRGRLCFGKGTESVSSFTEISSLRKHKIRAAYAGFNHSLFQTREGKILSCGYNYNGELLLSSGEGEDVYLPVETTITSDASFCIAGGNNSAVFIGNSPPPNTPNKRIQEFL